MRFMKNSTTNNTKKIAVAVVGAGAAGLMAAGTAALQGAVIKDEDKDNVAWKEYLENVMKKRGSEWLDLYKACKELC